MALYRLGDVSPSVAPSAYVSPNASIIGRAVLGENSSVWFGATLRGDNETITVGANILDDTQPATVVNQLRPSIDAFANTLPTGFALVTGGTVEESAKAQGPIAAVVPVMLLVMAFLLMVQLQSFRKLALVVSVAPLGLIGVVVVLLSFNAPLGFVALLGVLALIGIIIRNSVILVSQIDEFLSQGQNPWDAVVEATCHRVRPILLTAAAASLGMIPIAREIFWGPMAYAMIGGILTGTVLTLIFLPALYVAAYRIETATDGKKPFGTPLGSSVRPEA